MYYRIQEILADETPYIFLHTLNGMYAYRSNVQGADPRALQKFRNIDIWSVTSAK
jgi:ABC-type transport system substrate-binding protein